MEPVQISRSSRIWLWVAAWLVAAVAAAIRAPEMVRLGFLFPIGLLAFLPPDVAPNPGLGVVLIAGAYLIYPILSIVGISHSRRSRYFICYAVLCVLLAVNVVGCQVEIKQGFRT